MQSITTITEALEAIDEYRLAYPKSLKDDTKDALNSAMRQTSPVVQIVNFAETLYARREETNKTGKELAAGLFSFATTNGFHGLDGEEQRGRKIIAAMRRDAGDEPVAGSWPDKKDDPEPKAEFVRREEDEAAE